MCSAPKIPEAQKFQSSQAPVYRDQSGGTGTGRRGTILTGGSGIVSSSPTGKKTMLGQ